MSFSTNREIITVQVGQTGNRIGTNFWETVGSEHGLDTKGMCRLPTTSNNSRSSGITSSRDHPDYDDCEERRAGLGTLYRELPTGQYIPRAVLIDLEPSAVDAVRASPIGHQFPQHHTVVGKTGSGGTWADGYYGNGAELKAEVVDNVRRQVEACDLLQGVQMIYSLSGGTGSGVGTLILSALSEEYPDRSLLSINVVPSRGTCDTTFAAYNAVLSMNQLIESSTMTVLFDNDALRRSVCSSPSLTKNNKTVSPPFTHMNRLVGNVVSDITASLRFPGQLNTSLQRMALNLVPFPRLHLFSTTHANNSNITINTDGAKTETREQMFVQHTLDSRNCLVTPARKHFNRSNVHLAAALMMRGRGVSMCAVDNAVHSVKEGLLVDTYGSTSGGGGGHFCDWIRDSLKVSSCRVPSLLSKINKDELPAWSATCLLNSTQISGPLRYIRDGFTRTFLRRMHVWSYVNIGMDEMEFAESENNLNDIMSEYEQITDVSIYDCGEADEEEED
eukprot:PhM_4_TR18642/c3_g1_i10/m.23263/K07375/TUBB; tubulin beta